MARKFVKDFLLFCWSLIPFSVIYLDNCLRSSPWKFVYPWFGSIGPLFLGKCHLWKFILIVCLQRRKKTRKCAVSGVVIFFAGQSCDSSAKKMTLKSAWFYEVWEGLSAKNNLCSSKSFHAHWIDQFLCQYFFLDPQHTLVLLLAEQLAAAIPNCSAVDDAETMSDAVLAEVLNTSGA